MCKVCTSSLKASHREALAVFGDVYSVKSFCTGLLSLQELSFSNVALTSLRPSPSGKLSSKLNRR